MAGRGGGISGSTRTHNSSLISRDGGGSSGDDIPLSLRRHPGLDQSAETYFRNVFLRASAHVMCAPSRCGPRYSGYLRPIPPVKVSCHPARRGYGRGVCGVDQVRSSTDPRVEGVIVEIIGVIVAGLIIGLLGKFVAPGD